ncbi:hypothetical protein CDD80_751 [Ophiocordyceps camponoti-rufipedis]|uniref:Uncharacterized protein n=1 Tax=Ophiocordyceps camponoti-rufipedis TaxID=2004952 RepID=A0A2C5ZDM9_9HYPO|nr:hypothetical protein CDD80_751 [Ophiocordyceps camponoti-rufipedis]
MVATVKLLLNRDREAFKPFVGRGVEALLIARSGYDVKAHVVGGIELLASDLVSLADPLSLTTSLTTKLQSCPDEATTSTSRTLSMGLTLLRTLITTTTSTPTPDLSPTITLARRCLSSRDSGVRMEAVKLCVGLHVQLGEAAFWSSLGGVSDEVKSLITYYVVKRERESV